MASVNKVFIMGNLGQDPELRYTQSQTAVVTLNIATTEAWNKWRLANTSWEPVSKFQDNDVGEYTGVIRSFWNLTSARFPAEL